MKNKFLSDHGLSVHKLLLHVVFNYEHFYRLIPFVFIIQFWRNAMGSLRAWALISIWLWKQRFMPWGCIFMWKENSKQFILDIFLRLPKENQIVPITLIDYCCCEEKVTHTLCIASLQHLWSLDIYLFKLVSGCIPLS